MRVVYISTYPPDSCGIAIYLHSFIEASCPDYEYRILSNPLKNEKNTERIISRVLDPSNPVSSIKNALSIIKNFDPDIVHIQYVSNFFKPFMPILVNLISRPVIIESHEVLVDKTYRKGNFRKMLLISYEIPVYRKASKIIVHNTLMRSRLCEFYGMDPNKIEVIPLGVDTDVDYKKDYSLNNKFLFYGYLHEDKGIDTLIKAFGIVQKSTPDAELILLGGSRCDKTLKFIEDKKAQGKLNIRIEGFQKNISQYMKEADLVVFPHKDVSHSLAVAEAMAYGVPIIAAGVGGFTAQIKDGETGLLFSANSGSDLARVMLELINDERARERLGRNARQYALTGLSWENVCDKVLNLYEEVIKNEI